MQSIHRDHRQIDMTEIMYLYSKIILNGVANAPPLKLSQALKYNFKAFYIPTRMTHGLLHTNA